MSDDKKSKTRSYIRAIFLVVLAIWLLFLTWTTYSEWSFEQRGQFGDQFGAISALFSGLAFAGIVISLWMQRDELKLQRKELELQRDEIHQSRMVMMAQREEMEQSREL